MEWEFIALIAKEQTAEAKQQIFTKAIMSDKRGRMRCTGRGPTKASMREYAALILLNR
jgi:hypothetical protein